jgi:hypothetical protein
LGLNLGSCEYWAAVLTSRPPEQSADISVRTELDLCCRELTGGLLQWLSCQFQLLQFSSDLGFFSHSKGFWPWCVTVGITGLRPLSGILITKQHNVSGEGKRVDSSSETLCRLVIRIPNDG